MVGRKAVLLISTIGRFDVFVPMLAIANAWSLQTICKPATMSVLIGKQRLAVNTNYIALIGRREVTYMATKATKTLKLDLHKTHTKAIQFRESDQDSATITGGLYLAKEFIGNGKKVEVTVKVTS